MASKTLSLTSFDLAQKSATIVDQVGNLKLNLSFKSGCVVDSVIVDGRQVINPSVGMKTGVKVAGEWYTSADLQTPAKVARVGGGVKVSGIKYGGGGVEVVEQWTLTPTKDSIKWTIHRQYLTRGTLDDSAMPEASFSSMKTWTGALLGTGGVAWCKLLDSPNATYGVHIGSVTLWNPAFEGGLSVKSIGDQSLNKAFRFTREPSGSFSVAASLTSEALKTKYGKARFSRDRQDVWSPFTVNPSQKVEAKFELKAINYHTTFHRGDFKSLDTEAITELLNTIGRIGVIDDGIVGSNGWYSGYVCEHEPWLAQVGIAIDDPNYIRSCAEWLDDIREHAITPEGMVKSRWCYDDRDAQPGTYDPATGFYEAQWGRLMDSQTSYVTNVSDQFDLSGNKEWIRRQKAACESALDYLLKRDSNHNGLVEMESKSTKEKRSSDWLDIVWASNENAFVNAQLYGALIKWSAIEGVLGDRARARAYHAFAAKLKESFNKPISEGGFWNPEKGSYVYWRDEDGSIHGDNLTIPVNLTALGEGLCDNPSRRSRLLNTIEAKMNAESLLSWPACFTSYAPGEGADDKFPTYENGDIFLAWAEFGVRAYAPTEPNIALKYVRKIVDQYKEDGLAFQRYLRATGKGAGDDILANNCNIISGLYRDIYGIQPKYNRLYLEPHLTSDLDGTVVNYNFRNRPLKIELSTKRYRVSAGSWTAESQGAFGVDFIKNGFAFFEGDSALPSFKIDSSSKNHLTVDTSGWAKSRAVVVSCSSGRSSFTITFDNLSQGVVSVIQKEGKRVIGGVDTKLAATFVCKAGQPVKLKLFSEFK